MKFTVYDATGNIKDQGNTLNVAGQTITYDHMDVGILALQQTFGGADVYDFRVPGDPNKATFQYKFSRKGFLLGVSFTGTISAAVMAGVFAQKTDVSNGNQMDVMTPDDAGNKLSYNPTDFAKFGKFVMAPSPIPYNKGDLANMKFKSFSNSSLTVNLAGFLIIGLEPN